MGGGRWTDVDYTSGKTARKAAGIDDFAYDSKAKSTGVYKVHASLDPLGVKVRESRDSKEHPNSRAIAVLVDVTGSMSSLPRSLQGKLPELLGVMLRNEYAGPDPQFLFGGIGDATCDHVPLQVSQFESDVRIDEHLRNLVLEGGGGGQSTESYELAMYFMARHTALDCLEKRRKKGYLFIIGDEMPYSVVKRQEVKQIIGDGMQENISVEEIAKELQKKYYSFYLLPKDASHGGEERILSSWKSIFGQNVFELDHVEGICETIALTIGLSEGVIDLEKGKSHLVFAKAEKMAVDTATRALAKYKSGKALTK